MTLIQEYATLLPAPIGGPTWEFHFFMNTKIMLFLHLYKSPTFDPFPLASMVQPEVILLDGIKPQTPQILGLLMHARGSSILVLLTGFSCAHDLNKLLEHYFST
jgi:hypothetical protein